MGIMDTIKSKASSAIPRGQEATAFTDILAQFGGIQGLIQSFQQHGLGNVVQSWIGKGENLPISTEQLQSVIGQDKLTQASQKIGAQPDDLLHKLSQFLPQAVNQLTPDGEIHSESFSTASLLKMGKNFFGPH